MTTQHSTLPTMRRLPYFVQARTWYRYAKCLRDRSFNAHHKKGEAVTRSLHLRSRSLVFPAQLACTPDAEQGLYRLKRLIDERRIRFVELAARTIQVDDDDPTTDEVHLFLEEPDRTSSRNRRHLVGRLPQEDACWVVPLLRLESDFYGTGPLLSFFVEYGGIERTARGGIRAETAEVRVVIAHVHEAARQWLDWKEERAAGYDAFYRLRFYDERAYATL